MKHSKKLCQADEEYRSLHPDPSIWCAKFENIIQDGKMQIYQTNVLSNNIDDIIYPNVSKLHKYWYKIDGKSFRKIFYFIDCGNIYKLSTSQMNKVNYINFSERNVFGIIGNTLIKAKKIIIYEL